MMPMPQGLDRRGWRDPGAQSESLRRHHIIAHIGNSGLASPANFAARSSILMTGLLDADYAPLA